MSPAKPRFLPHLPADFLAEHQLAGIRWSVQQAMKSPQYRAKLAAAGIACGEDIKTLDDVRRLPFSDVADLRDGYPLPLLCVEPSGRGGGNRVAGCLFDGKRLVSVDSNKRKFAI